MFDILFISTILFTVSSLLAIIIWQNHRANVREAQLQLDLDTLSAERDQLARDKDKVVEALKALFGHVEDGTLVRDVSKDGESGWHLKMTRFVKDLADARAVLDRNFYEYPYGHLPKGRQHDEKRADSNPEIN